MLCLYCPYEIDTDEPGWGWYDNFEDMGDLPWHTECMEIEEGVAIA